MGADVGRMKTLWGADMSENKQAGGVGDCHRSYDREQTGMDVFVYVFVGERWRNSDLAP